MRLFNINYKYPAHTYEIKEDRTSECTRRALKMFDFKTSSFRLGDDEELYGSLVKLFDCIHELLLNFHYEFNSPGDSPNEQSSVQL